MNKKSCLIIIPTTSIKHEYSQSGVKISQLREFQKEFENEYISWSIATNNGKISIKYLKYIKGNQPIFNFENDERNRIWARENQELLVNSKDLENVLSDILNKNIYYDAILIPNSISIYEEYKTYDNCLSKILYISFKNNKKIACIGHSVYA